MSAMAIEEDYIMEPTQPMSTEPEKRTNHGAIITIAEPIPAVASCGCSSAVADAIRRLEAEAIRARELGQKYADHGQWAVDSWNGRASAYERAAAIVRDCLMNAESRDRRP